MSCDEYDAGGDAFAAFSSPDSARAQLGRWYEGAVITTSVQSLELIDFRVKSATEPDQRYFLSRFRIDDEENQG